VSWQSYQEPQEQWNFSSDEEVLHLWTLVFAWRFSLSGIVHTKGKYRRLNEASCVSLGGLTACFSSYGRDSGLLQPWFAREA